MKSQTPCSDSAPDPQLLESSTFVPVVSDSVRDLSAVSSADCSGFPSWSDIARSGVRPSARHHIQPSASVLEVNQRWRTLYLRPHSNTDICHRLEETETVSKCRAFVFPCHVRTGGLSRDPVANGNRLRRRPAHSADCARLWASNCAFWCFYII